MKRLAILSSGGDAPGMNAAIRAITLKAIEHNYEVIGFIAGFNGLLDKQYIHLNRPQVDDIIRQGGTILKSARCPRMHKAQGAIQAKHVLESLNIDALIVIGGDGSFKGCHAIAKQWSGQLIGVPGTIDNDINGTDQTIGFWTAIDTALGCIDKIRDTANAFERIFLVEVMGRDCGFIAVESAIASGAEHIICKEIIEDETQFINDLLHSIKTSIAKHRTDSYVIVVAENSLSITCEQLSQKIAEFTQVECKVAILGYLQRGGSPVASDRVLATGLGVAAVEAILAGKNEIMVATKDNQMCEVNFSETGLKNTDNQSLIRRLNNLNFNLN